MSWAFIGKLSATSRADGNYFWLFSVRLFLEDTYFVFFETVLWNLISRISICFYMYFCNWITMSDQMTFLPLKISSKFPFHLHCFAKQNEQKYIDTYICTYAKLPQNAFVSTPTRMKVLTSKWPIFLLTKVPIQAFQLRFHLHRNWTYFLALLLDLQAVSSWRRVSGIA
jgi:hypothetical protein